MKLSCGEHKRYIPKGAGPNECGKKDPELGKIG